MGLGPRDVLFAQTIFSGCHGASHVSATTMASGLILLLWLAMENEELIRRMDTPGLPGVTGR